MTSRIFLDIGGLKAWLAYFLATEGKAHFKGRQDRTATLAAVQKLSLGEKSTIAREVANVQPHATVSSAFAEYRRLLQMKVGHLIISFLDFSVVNQASLLNYLNKIEG